MNASDAPFPPSLCEAVDSSLTFLCGDSAAEGSAETGRKGRVAVGVFKTLEALDRALDAFQAQPPADVRVCLLADKFAFGGNLAARVAQRGAPNVGVVLLDGSRSARQPASDTDAACPQVARLEEWLDARAASVLRGHVADGACLLFIQVDDPVFEKLACQVLIGNSAGQIQVHDILLRQ